MVELADFLPYILPHAQSAPHPAIYQNLRSAAIEFCRSTRSWRHAAVFPVLDDTNIVVPLPIGANLFEVDKAWLGTRQLDPLPYADVDLDREPGLAQFLSCVTGNEFVLSPPESGDLRMTMFLEPARDVEELPDYLYHDHAETLAHGALAKLLILPNQPYTNPAMAGNFAALYQMAVDRLFSNNVRGKQRAPLRSRASFY